MSIQRRCNSYVVKSNARQYRNMILCSKFEPAKVSNQLREASLWIGKPDHRGLQCRRFRKRSRMEKHSGSSPITRINFRKPIRFAAKIKSKTQTSLTDSFKHKSILQIHKSSLNSLRFYDNRQKWKEHAIPCDSQETIFRDIWIHVANNI